MLQPCLARRFCAFMGLGLSASVMCGANAQSLLETTPERITRVVQTNLLGSLLCTRAAARAMAATGGGHIFNMDGAGADGQATPQYAAYGATKAGVRCCWGRESRSGLGSRSVDPCLAELRTAPQSRLATTTCRHDAHLPRKCAVAGDGLHCCLQQVCSCSD